MRKVSITVVMFLFLCLTLVGSAGAFFGDGLYSLGLGGIFINEWQLDYLKGLEPGELETGEYRLTLNAGRINSSRKYNYDKNNYYEDWDYGYNGYYIGFDTAVQNETYLNLGYSLVPEYTDEDNDKYTSDNINLALTHFLSEDKKVYGGYIRSKSNTKDYDDISGEYVLDYDRDDTDNIFYIGMEIRGSFPENFLKKAK
ncbi:MAG: hypothetical protein PWR10_1006 [Halanaerobiales bacterium]|nr:hypothetical protein [Halanaerobiales bacterium]